MVHEQVVIEMWKTLVTKALVTRTLFQACRQGSGAGLFQSLLTIFMNSFISLQVCVLPHSTAGEHHIRSASVCSHVQAITSVMYAGIRTRTT